MKGRAKILGYWVDNTLSFSQAVDYIASQGGQVITINPEMIMEAERDPIFSRIVKNARTVVPDGVGIQLGLWILGYKSQRIAGVELGKALIEKFSKYNKTIAMIGAKPEVIKLAVEKIKEEFPNANIVYSHDGYFDDEDKIIDEVVNAHPDLVLTALGSPKQEFFNCLLLQKLPKSVMIGLGGSFDVWAGTVERAPEIYQKLGLEWLYRTIKEPERFKRIFPTLPLFVLKVFKEELKGYIK